MPKTRWMTKRPPHIYRWNERGANPAEPKPVHHTLKVGDIVKVIPPADWYFGDYCEVVELNPDGSYCIGWEAIGYRDFERKELRRIYPKHYKENEESHHDHD